MGLSVDRLTAEDSRILKLERGAIRGHTCKVIVLERSDGRPLPTLDAIRRHVLAGLGAAPRLRQRIVPTPLRVAEPVWVDDAEFDIARHVVPVAWASDSDSGSDGHLSAIVGRLMCERLERSRPLWRLDVVERLDEDSMALVWRIHHSLADGTTGVRFGSEVLWSEDPEPVARPPVPWSPRPVPGAASLLALGVADRARRHVRHARAAIGPRASRAEVRHAVGRELRRSAAVTSLAQAAGPARAVAFAAAPLDACKLVGKAIGDGVTVNDVVLAIIAGGIRTWLEHDGGQMEGIRVKIPVSLHHEGEGAGIGNRDSYFFVDLPVTEPDVAKRALAINRETTERKLGHDAETLYRLGTHPFVSRWAMSPHVFTFNVSNVRGPANDVYVLGARIRELYSLAEIAQQHALRVAVISATGSLFFGLCADRDAVKDLDVLAAGLRRSADELLALGR
jgi:diacylglycerol O-acyltransferase / wax synthase